jgi:hypothetical protein
MTTTTQQKPIPDSRYVKQGISTGDFAAGERTTPITPKIEDFASGEHTLPTSPAVGDFASGEHTVLTPPASIDKPESPAKPIVSEGEFATWVRTTPLAPENPALVDTLPPMPAATDHKG